MIALRAQCIASSPPRMRVVKNALRPHVEEIGTLEHFLPALLASGSRQS
jgi:uncharacterized protein YktB (UPF0637 family)